jgi:hypothetical protein
MCVRVCPTPGEASVEGTIKPADPEHGRGCAEKAEASRGALQRAIASSNGNPLVVRRTGARHADGRLGGLDRADSEHIFWKE